MYDESAKGHSVRVLSFVLDSSKNYKTIRKKVFKNSSSRESLHENRKKKIKKNINKIIEIINKIKIIKLKLQITL